MLRRSLLITLVSLVAFVVSATLHNVIGGWLGVEEPVFFLIAVVVAPLGLLVGVVGSLVAALTLWRRRQAPR